MANKELTVRLINRYDSYQNWLTTNPVLAEGELVIVNIPETVIEGENGTITTRPVNVLKVGDGTTSFSNLGFVSGPASDVHSWAKTTAFDEANIPLANAAIKALQDADYQTSENVSNAITDALKNLKFATPDGTDTKAFVKSVTQTNGVISVTYQVIAISDVTGLQEALDAKADAADLITLEDVVSKLPTDESIAGTYATKDYVDTQDAALLGDADDTSSDRTIYGAFAAVDALKGTEGDLTTAATVYGARALAQAAKDVADENTQSISALDERLTNLTNGVSGAMHFVGVSSTDPAEGTVTVTGYDANAASAGDVVIYKVTGDNARDVEYVYDGSAWVELGDVTAEAQKITALENTVGDSSAGLVKDVADLKTAGNTYQTIENATKEHDALTEQINAKVAQDDFEELDKRVEAAEGTIGDHTTLIGDNAAAIGVNTGNISKNSEAIAAIQDALLTKLDASTFNTFKTDTYDKDIAALSAVDTAIRGEFAAADSALETSLKALIDANTEKLNKAVFTDDTIVIKCGNASTW